ncbi:hypothetical protein J2S74_004587 [Evansella vedderi]|uniref:DUF2922 domain-containing protein n=1 Tax=Evansella vedderi TaxID=38282 RepID=A0ABU0A2G0_9BACI|nr:DUF2922 domain-containing protein [Evansella vedderi]MDQ0257141.1 hypothetical protein [Evansella vedderi]
MTKRLELIFTNENGKAATISIDDPIEPVNPQSVAQAMDTIIASNVFATFDGGLVGKRRARVVERRVDQVDILL